MRTERGFTLLEVMVAFVIASLALAVLLPGAFDGLRSARIAGRYEEAVARARSHLASLDSRVMRLTPGVQQGDDGNGFRWQSRVAPIATTIATTSDPNALPGAIATKATLYAVSVTVSWAGHGVRLDTERVALEGARP